MFRDRLKYCLLFLLTTIFAFAGLSYPAFATMIVTVQGPESSVDTRYEYDQAVIRLALEKSKPNYGDYILQETAVGQNWARTLITATSGKFSNYIIKYSVSSKLPDGLHAIPFPVDLGIVGYRVAFVSHETKQNMLEIKTLDDLKRFEIIQGISWLDTDILRHHGFDVRVGSDYEAMFSMVAFNRSGLFLRGANELLGEWNTHLALPELTYDETISVYYPLPRFLVTAKENKELIARINEGLLIAHEDGSLLRLWEEKYLASVEFANLKSRKIFRLTNPFLKNVDPSWQKYVYEVAPQSTQRHQ
jgi:hypothetical protein